MRRHRTTARGVSLILLLGLSAGVAAARPLLPPGQEIGSGTVKPTPPPKPTSTPANTKNRIVFPLVGPAQYHNDFGEARPIGHEEGNDIMTLRHTPVVAPEPAKVKFYTDSGAGCMMYLYGKSKTTYVLLHLNNDLTKRNDNRGKCVAGVSYAPGLKSGQKVAAGQLIAFSGDSGNADGTPHLEFQMRPHGGAPVSPYRTLNRALRLMFAVLPGKTFTLSLSGKLVSASTSASDLYGATLKLKVTSLRVRPGNLSFPQLSRPLTLNVSADTAVQQIGSGPSPAAVAVSLETLLAAKKGRPLVVKTVPTKPTLQAQLGRVVLDASSVVLKPLK
jgi:hypothetical protein